MNRNFFKVAATMSMVFGLLTQNGNGQSINDDNEGYLQKSRNLEFFDENNYQKIEVSEGLHVQKINEKRSGESSHVIYKEIKNQPSPTKNNYHFKLTIEGNWMSLIIGNGDDFADMTSWNQLGGNIYETMLPEGYYDFVISGSVSYLPDSAIPAYISYDQILIDGDTEITVNMNEAVHKVSFNLVDVNNNPIDVLGDGVRYATFIDLTFSMHYSIDFTNILLATWLPLEDFYFFVNDMGTRNKIIIRFDLISSEGAQYLYSFQIENEVTGDTVLENTGEEVIHYTQMFKSSEILPVTSLYGIDGLIIYYDFENEFGHKWYWSRHVGQNYLCDESKPYSLYTNVKLVKENPVSGDINVFVIPVFFERYGVANSYRGYVVPFPMTINKNDELILDFFSHLEYPFVPFEGFGNNICSNHLSRVWNKDEYFYEGYRTPHLYYQARNYNTETNPNPKFNGAILSGGLVFMGEFNEKKFNHGDISVVLSRNNIEIYNDQIFRFNLTDMLNPVSSKYKMEITNDEVFAYDQNMVNYTTIEFDLSKIDANPPTLTMLRVIQNEKISMFISDVSDARLEITAGDFESVYINIPNNPNNYFNFIKYDKVPDIKVFWSYEGETFYELSVEEDVSKFHPVYGNFFNVSLSPLATFDLNNGWITIKIVLTDEVGNSQVQVLDPLFYYGDFVGIEKTILSNTAYPIPFTDLVTIELNTPISGLTYFEIYDISGRIVHQQKVNANETKTFSYNGKHLKDGVYFYGIYNQGKKISGKIVKN